MVAAPTSIPAETAGRFVPNDLVRAHRKQPQRSDQWDKFIAGLFDRIEKDNSSEWLDWLRKVIRNHNYYRGRQAGFFNEMSGRWENIDQGKFLYTNNYIRALVDRVAKERAKSETELHVRPSKPKTEAEAGARQADAIAKHYQQKLFPASIRQREAKFALLSGEYYRLVYWDTDAGPWTDEPVVEQQEIKIGPDTYDCPQCQMAGFAQNLIGAQCIGCGNTEVNIVPGPTTQVSVVTGTRKVRAGDINLEIPDPVEIKLDLHSRDIWESPWLHRKRMVLKEVVDDKFPWLHAQAMPSESAGEMALTYQRQQESSPGNTNSGEASAGYAYVRNIPEHMVMFEQLWLMPVMYKNYVFPNEVVLGDQEMFGYQVTIPAGTKAADMFKRGMYVARVNGVIVDIRPESKNDHWVMGVNKSLPMSIHGDGIEDAIEIQDLLNDTWSLLFEYLMTCTVPPVIYDERIIRGEEFVNKPGWKVPAHDLSPGDNLSNAVFQLEAQSLPQEVLAFIEMAKSDMVEHIGASSLEGNLPDVPESQTATQANLQHEQAVALVGLTLELKAEADVKTLTQVLRIVQENWQEDRYVSLLGNFGEEEGKWFKAADIPEDFTVTAVPGSWMPKMESDERRDLADAIQISGVPFGPWNPQMPPKLRNKILEAFRIDNDLDDYHADVRLAKIKLERLKLACEVAKEYGIDQMMVMPEPQPSPEMGGDMGGGMEEGGGSPGAGPQAGGMGIPEPMGLQFALQQVPLDPIADNPDVHIEILTEWLKSDEAISPNADKLLSDVIHARIGELMQTKVQMMQMMGTMAMMSMPPGMQAPGGGAPGGGAPGEESGNSNPPGKEPGNKPGE